MLKTKQLHVVSTCVILIRQFNILKVYYVCDCMHVLPETEWSDRFVKRGTIVYVDHFVIMT